MSYGYTNWLPTFFIKQGMSLNTSIGFTVIMSLGGTLGALDRIRCRRQVRPQAEPDASPGSARSFSASCLRRAIACCGSIRSGCCCSARCSAFTTLSIAVYMPELFATEYRARGAGVAFTCARIGIVVTPFPIGGHSTSAALTAVTAMFSSFMVIALAGAMAPRRRDPRQAA